jgi:hypothetical protein
MHRLLVVSLLLAACSSDPEGDDAAQAGSGGASAGRGGSTANSGRGGTGNTTGGKSSGGNGNAGRGGSSSGGGDYLDDEHTGNFWLGPVDYEETEWHNACAPTTKYPPGIRDLYGDYIMGLANEVVLEGLSASAGELCDTCVELTANGETLVAHVVTYGQETGPDDIDVSPEVDAALDGDAGRDVTWRFVSCPTNAPVQYTFDGRQWENTWFFRLWVRNARLPVTDVEYSVGSGGWARAERQADGAWQASGVDFGGGFSVRVTALDGQTLEDELPGLNTFDPDEGVSSQGNFQ